MKNNIKVIVAFILGLVLASVSVYAAILYQSSEVSYDNTNSGLTSQNVQDALDELHDSQSCTTQIDFATASWSRIAKAKPCQLQTSLVDGTTRSVVLGNLGTHQLRIANTSTPGKCTLSDYSQTACGLVIEFADVITTHNMNSTNTNIGGWPASEMRTYINGTIYNALPSDLKSHIIDTKVMSGFGADEATIFTSTDKMYLLSPIEVWEDNDHDLNAGIDYYDKSYNRTRQLDYYSRKNVTTGGYTGAQKSGRRTWWLRSAYYGNNTSFHIVLSYGNNSNYSASNAHGVSPAFRIE